MKARSYIQILSIQWAFAITFAGEANIEGTIYDLTGE